MSASDDDEMGGSGSDSDGECGPGIDVAERDAAVAEPPLPAAPAPPVAVGGLVEGADVWHTGWVRPVPDVRPVNKVARNHGDKLTDGPSARARSMDLSTPVKCFLALWNREVTDRIQRVTTAKLALRDKPALDHAELLKFFALEITMGLKRQGNVRSYYDTRHFGEGFIPLLLVNTLPAPRRVRGRGARDEAIVASQAVILRPSRCFFLPYDSADEPTLRPRHAASSVPGYLW